MESHDLTSPVLQRNGTGYGVWVDPTFGVASDPETKLWTRDKRQRMAAEYLGYAFPGAAAH